MSRPHPVRQRIRALHRCHDLLRAETGLAPVDALDALLGLLAGLLAGLPEAASGPEELLAARDRALDALGPPERTAAFRRELPAPLVRGLQAQLEGLTAGPTLAAALPAFLDRSLRQLVGAYPTPMPIARALARLGAPRPEDRILDPACGSGSLLVAASHLAPRAALVGVERDPRRALVASLRLATHPGPVHIELADGRTAPARHRPSLVLANPPFGLESGEQRFLEAVAEQLPAGGRSWWILPRSVLSNHRMAGTRSRVDAALHLETALTLPAEAFAASGTRLVPVILGLRRAQRPRARPVHLRLRTVGWDGAGQRTEDQLQEIDHRLRRARAGQPGPDDRLLSEDCGLTGLHHALQAEHPGRLRRPLGELCVEIRAGRTPGRARLGDQGRFLVKVGNLRDRQPDFQPRVRNYAQGLRPGRLGLPTVEPGDILLTGTAHRPRYIARKIDVVLALPAHLERPVLFSAEVLRLRPDPDRIDPLRLWCWLREASTRRQLRQRVRGQTAHLYPADLTQLPVPVVELIARYPDSLLRRLRRALAEEIALRARWRQLDQELDERAARPTRPTPGHAPVPPIEPPADDNRG